MILVRMRNCEVPQEEYNIAVERAFIYSRYKPKRASYFCQHLRDSGDTGRFGAGVENHQRFLTKIHIGIDTLSGGKGQQGVNPPQVPESKGRGIRTCTRNLENSVDKIGPVPQGELAEAQAATRIRGSRMLRVSTNGGAHCHPGAIHKSGFGVFVEEGTTSEPDSCVAADMVRDALQTNCHLVS